MKRRFSVLATFILAAATAFAIAAGPESFDFAILGDRTGEPQPGIWERVWRDAAASRPAFVLTAGDSIQGMDDATAEAQWRKFEQQLAPYRKIPLYLTPGNHDVWSAESAELYRKYSKRPLHYGFDHGGAHFTILDNSRSDTLPAAEMAFLEGDLRSHSEARVKFVVMHRPSWIVDAPLRNRSAPLHQLAKQYGVRYMIAGHVHQLIHTEFDGVTYYAVPSAGGHLRLSGKYEDGWFFGWTQVEVAGSEVHIQIRALDGRTTSLADWGLAGLAR